MQEIREETQVDDAATYASNEQSKTQDEDSVMDKQIEDLKLEIEHLKAQLRA